MRIAMVDPSLFTPSYDQALATGLMAAGHDVTLYGRRPGAGDSVPGTLPFIDLFYRFAANRGVAALPGPVRLSIKGADHAWSMMRLLRRLRREKPDVIHFQWLALPIVDRRLLMSFRRIAPLVLTVHDTNPFNGNPSSRLQSMGIGACMRAFDGIIVHTEQGRSRLERQDLNRDRIAVIPNGPAWPAPPPPPADPMLGPLTLTLFGKLKHYKGADILIDAFSMIPDDLRAQARVRIVGKSYMDLGPLRALAATKGVTGSVVIEDRFVPDDGISEIFGPRSIAVFPYREIEASGVLPQALAHGRPIVASDLGWFSEALSDGVHGHLVPPGDAVALSVALAHVIGDRRFAAACGERARDLAGRSVSWEAIAARTDALYRAVIAPVRRTVRQPVVECSIAEPGVLKG